MKSSHDYFQEYWTFKGSREQVESHEERAQRAFIAGWKAAEAERQYQRDKENANLLCGMSFK